VGAVSKPERTSDAQAAKRLSKFVREAAPAATRRLLLVLDVLAGSKRELTARRLADLLPNDPKFEVTVETVTSELEFLTELGVSFKVEQATGDEYHYLVGADRRLMQLRDTLHAEANRDGQSSYFGFPARPLVTPLELSERSEPSSSLLPTWLNDEKIKAFKAADNEIGSADQSPVESSSHQQDDIAAIVRSAIGPELSVEAIDGLSDSLIEKTLDSLDSVQLEQQRIFTLGKIAARSLQAERIKSDLDALTTTARALGITWNQIGRAAGITPQAAHRRWDAEARRKHSEYRRQRNSVAQD
jgi:hypothetical protein